MSGAILSFSIFILAFGLIWIQIEYLYYIDLQYRVSRALKYGLVESFGSESVDENFILFEKNFKKLAPPFEYEIMLVDYQEYPKLVSYRVKVNDRYWFEETMIEEGIDEG